MIFFRKKRPSIVSSRLEMQSARLQSDIKKEAEARESECEELRASYQRRVSARGAGFGKEAELMAMMSVNEIFCFC